VSTWSGWAADFLAAASLPNTANNLSFMNEWAANATAPGCENNPNDLTFKISGGSSNCHATGQVGVTIQRYTTHAWARTAFDAEIHSGKYPHLLAALKSGSPFGVNDTGKVATDLGNWSSTKYANIYLHEAQAVVKQPRAPHMMGGWEDTQKSLRVNMRAALRRSSKNRQAALQALARARKVKL